METKTRTDAERLQDIGRNAHDALEEMVARLRLARRLESGDADASDFTLLDDGTMDTVVQVDATGEEIRFSGETAADYRDESGALDFEAFVDDEVLPALDSEEYSEDRARERIQEDPLNLELRGTWQPGEKPEADEAVLLLSTGGPAVRLIVGLGQYAEPSWARLEAQDWFLPWTPYHGADEGMLLEYAACFYYGE